MVLSNDNRDGRSIQKQAHSQPVPAARQNENNEVSSQATVSACKDFDIIMIPDIIFAFYTVSPLCTNTLITR